MVSKNSDSGVRYKDSFFYTLSKNIAAQNAPLLRTYRVVVDLIPAILQDPDNICVKLAINDQEFTTRNYSECKVQNEHEITIDDVGVGQLVAGLTDSQSTTQKDSFTKEENEFFDLVCQWLSQVTKSSQIKTMIKKSDIKFRSLVNDAKEGIYICDLKGTFIYANYSLAKILGGEQPIDITGRNFVDFLPSNRKKELHNQFQKSLETGKISSMIETEIIKEDGTTGFIEIKPSIFVIDGIIRGNQGIILDVTERIEKEKKLMYESTHDSLTGLFNNTFFEAEIKRIERGRQFPVSIVVLRLDLPAETEVDNKNDQPANKLVKRVAHKLFSTYRGDDIVARIGVNDFGILLPNVSETNVDITVQRIHKNLQEKNISTETGPLKYYLGVSTAEQGQSLSSALKHAFDIVQLSEKKDKGP